MNEFSRWDGVMDDDELNGSKRKVSRSVLVGD